MCVRKSNSMLALESDLILNFSRKKKTARQIVFAQALHPSSRWCPLRRDLSNDENQRIMVSRQFAPQVCHLPSKVCSNCKIRFWKGFFYCACHNSDTLSRTKTRTNMTYTLKTNSCPIFLQLATSPNCQQMIHAPHILQYHKPQRVCHSCSNYNVRLS